MVSSSWKLLGALQSVHILFLSQILMGFHVMLITNKQKNIIGTRLSTVFIPYFLMVESRNRKERQRQRYGSSDEAENM